MQKKRSRPITLVEMMIVMFLIALIGGFVAYSVKGALDEGKAFKTKQGTERLRSILELHLAEHPADREQMEQQWQRWVERSALVKNPQELTRDGWGIEYQVKQGADGQIEIHSDAYERYLRNKEEGGR